MLIKGMDNLKIIKIINHKQEQITTIIIKIKIINTYCEQKKNK
jgi:hypothetical protein